MTTDSAAFDADFDAWWQAHGQYLRAGGGQYEITFAYEAAKHFRAEMGKEGA